jgi:hypothetical protein
MQKKPEIKNKNSNNGVMEKMFHAKYIAIQINP